MHLLYRYDSSSSTRRSSSSISSISSSNSSSGSSRSRMRSTNGTSLRFKFVEQRVVLLIIIEIAIEVAKYC